MAQYRFFFLGNDDHIVRADVVDCSTDDDAVAAARVASGDHRAVEVWELARCVEGVDAAVDTNDGVP